MDSSTTASSPSRRKFLRNMGGVAAVTSTIGLTPAFGAMSTNPQTAPTVPAGAINPRVIQSFLLRVAAATRNAAVPVPPPYHQR